MKASLYCIFWTLDNLLCYYVHMVLTHTLKTAPFVIGVALMTILLCDVYIDEVDDVPFPVLKAKEAQGRLHFWRGSDSRNTLKQASMDIFQFPRTLDWAKAIARTAGQHEALGRSSIILHLSGSKTGCDTGRRRKLYPEKSKPSWNSDLGICCETSALENDSSVYNLSCEHVTWL